MLLPYSLKPTAYSLLEGFPSSPFASSPPSTLQGSPTGLDRKDYVN